MRNGLEICKKFVEKYFTTIVFLLVGSVFFLRVSQINQPNRYIFDEDFFAYTAQLMGNNDSRVFEWWHGPLEQEINQFTYRAPAVEWLHPPLSKSIQAVSIVVFGNTPFAWRFPSVIAGIGLIWLSIELTQALFGKPYLSLLVGLLISLEHLLTTQSKIASPDIFLAFFVLLTVWRFWLYHQKRTIFRLINTGIALGLAVACKWSGFFLLPGLLLFEWLYLSQEKPRRTYVQPFFTWLITSTTILLTASIIYLLSYWQLFYQGHSFKYFVELHQQIIHYQTTTTFERPYSSRPWQWLLGEKPIWYYYQKTIGGKVDELVARPSLGFLILGELAFCISSLKLLKKKKSKAERVEQWPRLLLILSITSLFVPWLFISRPLFIYHFTPLLPLLIIILADQTNQLLNRPKKPNFESHASLQ